MLCLKLPCLASWRKLGGVSQSGEGRKGQLGSPELGHGGEKAEGQSIRRSFMGLSLKRAALLKDTLREAF